MIVGSNCLIDTNSIIRALDNSPAESEGFAKLQIINIPFFVIGELLYGAYKSSRKEKNLQSVTNLIKISIIIYPDFTTADCYGQIKAQLKTNGTPIPNNDIWIAAQAKQFDMTLITNDKHFQYVEGIKLVSW